MPRVGAELGAVDADAEHQRRALTGDTIRDSAGLPVHHPGGGHRSCGRNRELRRVCANHDRNSVGFQARHGSGNLALVLDVPEVERDRDAVDAALGVDHLRGEGRAEILVGRVGGRAPRQREDRADAERHRPCSRDGRARRGQHREDQNADQPEVAGTLGAEALQHRPILPAECAARACPEAQWWSAR